MKIFRIFYVTTFICIFTISSELAQNRPSWFDKVQVFQFGYGYYINPSPIISKVNFTGQGWGVYFPTGWDKSTLESEINAWHSRGKIYVPFSNVYVYFSSEPIPGLDKHRLTDLDGNFIQDPGTGWIQYTVCSPLWRDFLKEQIKKAIDLGADGFQFDGAQCPPLLMLPWNSPPASFDSVTMACFRDYLRNKYSEAELFAKFEIGNIQIFHYGDWIKSHNQEATWNQEPLRGLGAEFFTYMLLETKEFFHEISKFAHQYASDMYGKGFSISCNPGFSTYACFLYDEVDYLLSEHYPFHEAIPFAHTDIKVTKSINDWPVFILPEPNKSDLPKTTQNMIKLIVSDIYSNGGYMCFGESLTEGLNKPINIDFNILELYMNFIFSNRLLYENLSFQPQVALLYSMSSGNAVFWPIEGDAHVDGWGSAFYGAGRLLTDSNIQFDCVFAPDNRFTTIPSFTLSQLKKYKVVVLPHTFELTDEQSQTLLNYIQEGGIIVAMGNIGTNNPDGTLANRPQLLSLQQGEEVKSYGLGKFIYNPTSLGEAYIWDWGIPHSTVRQQFQSMILPYIQPEIKTYNISEVYRAGGATGFLYQDPHGNYILHLVNYDYNEYTDVFAVKENFTLKILADTTRSWQAVYVSPDFLGQQVLPTTNDSGYIKMTIPKLEAYGIVILQENQTAPQIVSRFPSNGATIIAGDSLNFSVKATDKDNNHLFYQWYINRRVDSLAMDSTYIFKTDHSSSGIDTILVEVSDGNQKVSTSWIVTVQMYQFPKILFDESHNERNTISTDRAQILNPSNPDWISFGILKSKMDLNYITERYTTGSLSTSILQNYNILILSAPDDNLSSSEINSIVSFVSNGGGLVFLGDHHLNQNINILLQYFGIQFDYQVIFEPVAEGQVQGNPSVLNFNNNVPLGTYPRFNMNWGGSFSVYSPGMAIAFTDSATWRNLDDNNIHNTNEPLGPFIVIAAAEYGSGKVFCISDNALHDDYLKSEGCPNDELFLNALGWLSEKVNQVIPVEFTFFTATAKDDQVELNWSTATETNNLGFEIQRSQDKINFIKVGFVEGNQTTTVPHKYSFIDRNVIVGTCYYRLKQIDNNGSYKYSPIVESLVGIPKTFELSQNYPNPFNPNTTIKYQLPKSELITITIYNVLGQSVRTLISENKNAGYYTVNWDGKSDYGNDAASGVYIYCLRTKDFVKSLKMVLIR